MDKIREEIKKLLLAKYLWTDLVCEELLDEIMPILQQEMIEMLPEKMNLPIDMNDWEVGYNQSLEDMHSKIMGIKPGEER